MLSAHATQTDELLHDDFIIECHKQHSKRIFLFWVLIGQYSINRVDITTQLVFFFLLHNNCQLRDFVFERNDVTLAINILY